MTTQTAELIYLDHASTTPVAPGVIEAMHPYLADAYGNAGASHRLGRRGQVALEAARAEVARFLSCDPDELVFTSGGTEANNLAVGGVLEAAAHASAARPHVVTSAVEHLSVLAAAERSAEIGAARTSQVGVDSLGRVHLDQVASEVTPDTALVAVMLANNEVGTIQPVAEVANLAHEHGALVHVDAVQAAAWRDIDVQELGADTLSLSAHKVSGPKGVGVLYVRRDTPMRAQLVGGGQERGLRSGTENVAGAVGLAAALRLAQERRDSVPRVAALGESLLSGLLSIEGVRLTGHPTARLPNIVSVCVVGVSADLLLLGLDASGICVSSGSACASGRVEPSHVLTAMGIPEEQARGALRLSLGWETSESDIERVLEVLPGLVRRLRQAAPHG